MKYNKEFYDQCFKACNVSREELGPAELIRYTRMADASAILSGREYDTLVGLVQHGPLAVGCEPSKAGRSDLIEKGLCVAVVVKGDPSNYAATNDGYEVWRMYNASRADGAVQVNKMLGYRHEHEIPDPEVRADTPPLITGGGLPAQVLIQVPTDQVENVKAQHYPMATIVRSKQELNSCKDPIVILAGGSPDDTNYNWVLDSGELVPQLKGNYRVIHTSDGAVWLRCWDGPSGGKFDLIDWVLRALHRDLKAGSLESKLQVLKSAMAKPIPADEKTARLVKWGVLHETAGMCSTTDLGIVVLRRNNW